LGLSGSAGRKELLLCFQIFQIPLALMAIKIRRFGDHLFVVQAVLIAEMTDGAQGFNQNMPADPRFFGFSLSDHIGQTLVGIAVLYYHLVSNYIADETPALPNCASRGRRGVDGIGR